jgi:hypothetical protein
LLPSPPAISLTFFLSGETLMRCPRKERPCNRRFPLAGCNSLFQSVPMYGHLNCVIVIQDAVGIIWPSGNGYHSCFLLLIQDSLFQVLKLISYSNIPKNYQYYGHNTCGCQPRAEDMCILVLFFEKWELHLLQMSI